MIFISEVSFLSKWIAVAILDFGLGPSFFPAILLPRSIYRQNLKVFESLCY